MYVIFIIWSAFFLSACGSAPATKTPSKLATETTAPFWAITSEVDGSVQALKFNEEVFLDVYDGDVLYPFDQIKTNQNAKARLDLSSGAIIRITPNSYFILEPVEKSPDGLLQQITLQVGKVWIILRGGAMDVKTPSGVAAVRGSYMSVSYFPESGTVFITCLEGVCSLENDYGSVTLQAGQTATITGFGEKPVIGEMTEEDVQDWLDNNPEAALVVSTPEPTETTPPEETEEPPTLEPPPAIVVAPPVYFPPASDPPATTLTPNVMITSTSSTSSVVGELVTIYVVVTGSGALPTGGVEIQVAGDVLCSFTLDINGMGSCEASFSEAITHSLSAYYFGDSNYGAGSSPSFPQIVGQAGTTTTIVSHSPNPSEAGESVDLTATVDNVPLSGVLPYGSVTFKDGGTSLCTALAAPWTCAFNFSSDGSYSIVAVYSGDANFFSSTSSAMTHTVATTDTTFSNLIGPQTPPITITNATCAQAYSVDVTDPDAVTQVDVEYAPNPDFTGSTTEYMYPLTIGSNTWEQFISISGSAGDIIYWRFVATDGNGNVTYFGGDTVETVGTSSYQFKFDAAFTGCP